MSVIFYSKQGNGGYGDRLVGLITCYFISKITKRNFYIYWEYPLLDKYIKINNLLSKLEDFIEINLIDERAIKQFDNFKEYNLEKLWGEKKWLINCNQNLIPYLYMNINYNLDKNKYEEDISEMYRDIYTKFLIPTDYLLLLINKKKEELEKYSLKIGIHIRTGDWSMNNSTHILYNDSSLENIIKHIYNYISKKENYGIYIASDYKKTIELFQKYEKNIIYCDTKITHFDYKNNDEGIITLFIDHFLLISCDELITHSCSNFGRTAAIISKGKKIGIGYPNFLEEITIKQLAGKNNCPL